jgi:hypothetical protein
MVMHKSSIFRLEECSDCNRSLACLNITDLFSSSYFEQKVVYVNIIALCGEIAFEQALLV